MAARSGSKFELLAAAVARGATVAAGAREHDVPARTAGRWSATPEFKARVRELRSKLIDAAIGRLAGSAEAAVLVLRAQLLEKDARPADRIAAARSILGHLIDLSDHLELSERVAELERRLNEQPQDAA